MNGAGHARTIPAHGPRGKCGQLSSRRLLLPAAEFSFPGGAICGKCSRFVQSAVRRSRQLQPPLRSLTIATLSDEIDFLFARRSLPRHGCVTGPDHHCRSHGQSDAGGDGGFRFSGCRAGAGSKQYDALGPGEHGRLGHGAPGDSLRRHGDAGADLSLHPAQGRGGLRPFHEYRGRAAQEAGLPWAAGDLLAP